jgi:hypothetical protein
MRDVLIKVGMTAAAIAVFSLLVFSKDAAVQLGVLLTLALAMLGQKIHSRKASYRRSQ